MSYFSSKSSADETTPSGKAHKSLTTDSREGMNGIRKGIPQLVVAGTYTYHNPFEYSLMLYSTNNVVDRLPEWSSISSRLGGSDEASGKAVTTISRVIA